MASEYKIWIEIEEIIDGDYGHEPDHDPEPVQIIFDNREEAVLFRNNLVNFANDPKTQVVLRQDLETLKR